MNKFQTIISSRTDLDWCWFLRRQGASGEAVERVMHDVGVLQPGGWANWQGSTLTSTGALATASFRSGDRGLRVTTEIADPGGNRHWHLERARQIVERLAPGAIPDAYFAGARQVQSGTNLRFGARLQLTASGRKVMPALIAEWPANAQTASLPDATLSKALARLPFAARIVRVSYDAAEAAPTVTLRATGRLADALPKLCAIADVPSGPLQQMIGELTAPGMQPGRDFGFGLTAGRTGLNPTLTLHLPATDLSRNETALTQKLRGRLGGQQGGYATLMDMHLTSSQPPIHHGAVSLTARSAGAPDISVAVAAPWACPLGPMTSFRTEAAIADNF